MSLEKWKMELEFLIERATDPVLIKRLKEELTLVLRLIDEMTARIRWLMHQREPTSPAKTPPRSAAALAILTILSIQNNRAALALANLENLPDWELWGLIASIALDESRHGQSPFGLAIGPILRPKISDWRKLQSPSMQNHQNGSEGLRKKPKP